MTGVKLASRPILKISLLSNTKEKKRESKEKEHARPEFFSPSHHPYSRLMINTEKWVLFLI
jgi:hypothetical protein